MTLESPFTPDLRAELGRELSQRGATVLVAPEGLASPASWLAFRAEHAEELLPWLTQWAQSRGLSLQRLSVEEATLEGAFLGMIGDAEENGEASDSAGPSSAGRLAPGREGEVP